MEFKDISQLGGRSIQPLWNTMPSIKDQPKTETAPEGSFADVFRWAIDNVKETDAEPGNRLRLAFDIRSAKGTAVTCKAPTGSFQVRIDGKKVGDPIKLTAEAFAESPHSTIEEKDITVRKGSYSALFRAKPSAE